MKGSDIVTRVRTVINDADAIRWTDAEMALWINDGCRFIVVLRPDACVVNQTMSCVAGTKQSIAGLTPAGLRVMDIVRNIATGRAIRAVDREVLDTQIPTWHASSAGVPTNYVFDPRDPKTFYLYPPVAANHQIEIVYSRNPVTIAAADLGTTDLSLDDIYMDPLVNYVLFRLYSKDAEFAQNAQLAAGYLSMVNGVLGGKTNTDRLFSPAMNAPGDRPSKAAAAGGI